MFITYVFLLELIKMRKYTLNKRFSVISISIREA